MNVFSARTEIDTDFGYSILQKSHSFILLQMLVPLLYDSINIYTLLCLHFLLLQIMLV